MTDSEGFDTAVVAAGVDIGGTNVRMQGVCAGGLRGEALLRQRPEEPEAMVDAMLGLLDELTAQGPVSALGVGCAGLVDRDGVVRTSPNIPTLIDFPLRDVLSERSGLPVTVENDATSATWAEHHAWHAGQSSAPSGDGDDLAFVTLGTGIGGGFVFDGHLYRGAGGFAGEIGHMTIVPDGILCPCGRRGCWERYASGSALSQQASAAAAHGAGSLLAAAGRSDAVTGEEIGRLLAEGDPAANAVLERYADWVAVGLDVLTNVVDPGVFVIGGGVSALGEPLVAAVSAKLTRRMVDAGSRPVPPVRLSVYGWRAGSIGAGLLALDLLAGQH